MSRALAQLGDKTTGGHIISATSSMSEGTNPLVRNGDEAWCFECDGPFQINGTARGYIDDTFMVGHGDRVLCHCASNQVYATSTVFDENPTTSGFPGGTSAGAASPSREESAQTTMHAMINGIKDTASDTPSHTHYSEDD